LREENSVREPKTHFEQVPVEIVKKIATKLPAQEFPEDEQLKATVDDDHLRKRVPHTPDVLKQPGDSGGGQS
jgi:hypothetical protein